MRTCVIVNPTAGTGRVERVWPQLKPHLRNTIPNATVRWTTAPKTATTLTRDALQDGVERIVALGGDGTLHEVVNGFFDKEGNALRSSAVLAPLLCGTGTDFRRALQLPKAQEAVRGLARNRIRPIDLLRVTYSTGHGHQHCEYAINVTSFGLSSSVVRSINERGGSFSNPTLRYLAAILRALTRHKPVPIELAIDGTSVYTGPIRVVAVANGPSFGAGIRIAPDAQIDDGWFDVTILRDVAISRLLLNARRFYRGTHTSIDGVSTFRGQRLEARASTDHPVWMEADGEFLGRLPATVDVVPGCIRLQY